MLRTMKRATYVAENTGHFGLASERYTHFTSPIRRYPDLIVHRLLRADRGSDRQPPFDQKALESQLGRIATESSDHERNAEDAERQYVDWKKVQFMADKVGTSFEGYITSVHAFGFFVELDAYFVEGLVHVSALADDFYRYDEKHHCLTGEASGRKLALGNRVRVQLAKVDQERRRLDFALEEGPLDVPVIEGAEALKEESAEGGSGRGRRPARKRRRRKKTSAAPEQTGEAKEQSVAEEAKKGAPARDGRRRKKASSADSSEGKEQAAAGEEKKASPARKRRRRRKAGGPATEKTAEAKADKPAADKTTGERKTGERKTSGRKASGRKTSKRKTSDKKTSDQRTSRRKTSGQRTSKDAAARPAGRRSRKKSDPDKSKSTKVTKENKTEQVEKKKERPKRVNPYITDL
jgi:hypothetical protein